MGEKEQVAIERFKRAAGRKESGDSRRAGSAFVPAADDVFIVTPPKCGTTWTQQILHMLRSRGDMDFDEISMVIPFLEMAVDSGYGDPDQPQPWSPRAFKTHFHYDFCPHGARYIYVMRDPRDAAVSLFHFIEGWFFGHGEISLSGFLQHFFLKRHIPHDATEFPSIWQHMVSWWPQRNDPSVLWLFFEDLKEHPAEVVQLISSFIGVDTASDPDLLQLVLHKSSIGFMKEHGTKFDDHPLKLKTNEQCGLDQTAGLDGQGNSKVRSGESGSWRAEMPGELQTTFEARWRGEVLPVTGCGTYEELRQAVNKELRRPWVA